MPVFTVTLSRETVDEITVQIEAPNRTAITRDCLPSTIYEGVNSDKDLKDWSVVENEIWVDECKVAEASGPPEFLLQPEAGDDEYVLVPAPKVPYVDPRQTKMFPEEEEDNA